jgi:hypothetical protein
MRRESWREGREEPHAWREIECWFAWATDVLEKSCRSQFILGGIMEQRVHAAGVFKKPATDTTGFTTQMQQGLTSSRIKGPGKWAGTNHYNSRFDGINTGNASPNSNAGLEKKRVTNVLCPNTQGELGNEREMERKRKKLDEKVVPNIDQRPSAAVFADLVD